MTIYIPCHTHCSTDGGFSGADSLGVAFTTRAEAQEYLKAHPNIRSWLGDGESIIEVELAPAGVPG